MRLFVSIDPPEGIRKKLTGWVPDIQEIKKTKPEQIHLTLLFLGDQADNSLPHIIENLENVKFEVFDLTITGLGAFPHTSNPKVLWAGIKRSPDLLRLQKEIEDRLSQSIPDEKGSFKPHLTLARTEKLPARERKKIFSQHPDPLTFQVSGFSLKKSVLSASGAEHEVLKKFG